MKTIGEVTAAFKQALTPLYDARESQAITMLVLTDLLGTSRARIKAFPEEELSDTQFMAAINLLEELKTGKPVQYVLGRTEFYGLTFKVTPAVLIPRPETEELVAWAIDSANNSHAANNDQPFHILDIGTGSGCIAISLKKNLPEAQVSAIDISAGALTVAAENAAINKVEITFIEADILNFQTNISDPSTTNLNPSSFTTNFPAPTNYTNSITNHKSPPAIHYPPLATPHSPFTTHHPPLTSNYSLIISNPPYVTPEDKTRMHSNVNDFEPHIALFVPEADPLLFYKAIADFAANSLINNGLLFFEINETYGNETIAMLKAKGFRSVELRQDMSGRDRMIKAIYNTDPL